MSKLRELFLGTALVAAGTLAAHAEPLGLGRAALPEEIAAWDITILPDGTGLRPGSGNVEDGEDVFADACAACHGDFAEGIDSWPPLAGGLGTLTDARPVKTVGSYWPYLSTVFDYVNRSMPFGGAQTLSTDDVYAITAYILYSNNLVDDDFTLSHENFTEVELPNAGGFYADDRAEVEYPGFSGEPCMNDCRPPVQVTRSAADMNVTPLGEDGRPAGTLPALLASADEAAPEPGSAPEAAAAAGPDPALVAEGEGVFRKCSACHKVGEGARNGVGPVLNGIVGHPAGAVDGYRYSKPLMDAAADGLVWTPEELSAFLENPKQYLPRTKMSFAGLRSEDERAAVIAYMQSLER